MPLFFSSGEMSERFKVQSWKGCVPKGTGGSNPPLSDKIEKKSRILEYKKTGIRTEKDAEQVREKADRMSATVL